jgi:hypothetical protein
MKDVNPKEPADDQLKGSCKEKDRENDLIIVRSGKYYLKMKRIDPPQATSPEDTFRALLLSERFSKRDTIEECDCEACKK